MTFLYINVIIPGMKAKTKAEAPIKKRSAILIRMDETMRDNLKRLAFSNNQYLEPFIRQALQDLLNKK